jgi:hypothetical protein
MRKVLRQEIRYRRGGTGLPLIELYTRRSLLAWARSRGLAMVVVIVVWFALQIPLATLIGECIRLGSMGEPVTAGRPGGADF